MSQQPKHKMLEQVRKQVKKIAKEILNEQPKHTPMPWHVGMRPGPIVYGELGEQVADCRGLDEDGFNATFIVRACNAHEEMLAALEAASRYADFSECREVADMVKAAIAKAKGE